MPTVCAAVLAVIELEQAFTVIESMRRPLVDVGVSCTMFAAASDAVAVGARVVQAVTAASDRVMRYGVWANMGVAVVAIYSDPKLMDRKMSEPVVLPAGPVAP